MVFGNALSPASPSAPVAPKPSIQTLTLALPIQHPRPNNGGGNGGVREDCWSEGATSVLIDAWGERYLELSRGNLRQKHWQEVAEAVTSRDGYSKVPKTDVQCKNRIDTLKKKYKAEKSKPATKWPFFHRLDLLLGLNHSTTRPNTNPNPNSQPQNRPLTVPQFPQRQRTGQQILAKRVRSPPSVSSDESSDGFPPEPVVNGKKKKENGEIERNSKTKGICAVTRSIIKLGKVYERVEKSKLQQEMELEKHKMELEKELAMKRMQFLMKMQVGFSQLDE